jgi:hypothetical protein
LFNPQFHDVSIWEEIRSTVRWEIDRLVESIRTEISNDVSLAEFRGNRSIPWQLSQIMEQRANVWIQSTYDLCCEARKRAGKELSADFDRAMWAYCIEPFIMGETESGVLGNTGSGLLELLLCAVGSPPKQRHLLRVSQKQCCLSVRLNVFEAWRSKLIGVPSRREEAVAVMARANERGARAMRVARGLPPEPPAQPPSADQAAPLVQGAPTAAPQSAPESSSAALPQPPASQPVHEETVIEPEGETPCQSSGVQEPAWETIEIVFLSDERVQICNGVNRETRNYAEFGFADGRNENPNQAWIMLRALAEQEGVIQDGKKTGQPWPKVEKQVQEIRKVLRKHFGISADPIPFVKDVGYRACFKIGLGRSFHT